MLLWLVGNSIVEPNTNTKVLALFGGGSSGKSALLRNLATMMGCDVATATVPNPFEPGCRGEALDTLLISAATHRVCLCDGADLGEYTDLRVLKRLTGQADVECFGLRVRPKALFVVATTTLFDLHAPEFQTPAIARRLLALRLPRQFNSMRDQAPTMMGGGRATMWLSCAVALRLFNPVMPAPSFESTCYTLCGNAAGLAMQLVRRSNADDVCKSSSATAMLARAHLGGGAGRQGRAHHAVAGRRIRAPPAPRRAARRGRPSGVPHCRLPQ